MVKGIYKSWGYMPNFLQRSVRVPVNAEASDYQTLYNCDWQTTTLVIPKNSTEPFDWNEFYQEFYDGNKTQITCRLEETKDNYIYHYWWLEKFDPISGNTKVTTKYEGVPLNMDDYFSRDSKVPLKQEDSSGNEFDTSWGTEIPVPFVELGRTVNPGSVLVQEEIKQSIGVELPNPCEDQGDPKTHPPYLPAMPFNSIDNISMMTNLNGSLGIAYSYVGFGSDYTIYRGGPTHYDENGYPCKIEGTLIPRSSGQYKFTKGYDWGHGPFSYYNSGSDLNFIERLRAKGIEPPSILEQYQPKVIHTGAYLPDYAIAKNGTEIVYHYPPYLGESSGSGEGSGSETPRRWRRILWYYWKPVVGNLTPTIESNSFDFKRWGPNYEYDVNGRLSKTYISYDFKSQPIPNFSLGVNSPINEFVAFYIPKQEHEEDYPGYDIEADGISGRPNNFWGAWSRFYLENYLMIRNLTIDDLVALYKIAYSEKEGIEKLKCTTYTWNYPTVYPEFIEPTPTLIDGGYDLPVIKAAFYTVKHNGPEGETPFGISACHKKCPYGVSFDCESYDFDWINSWPPATCHLQDQRQHFLPMLPSSPIGRMHPVEGIKTYVWGSDNFEFR